jgi:hypothetical protein
MQEKKYELGVSLVPQSTKKFFSTGGDFGYPSDSNQQQCRQLDFG